MYHKSFRQWWCILLTLAACTAFAGPVKTVVPQITASNSALLLVSPSPVRTVAAAQAPTQVQAGSATFPSMHASPAPLPTLAVPSRVLRGHTCPVSHLSWSPDGAQLASSCGDFDAQEDTIRVWSADGTPAGVLEGHRGPVTALAWSPDGKTLTSSSLDGTIRLWNLASASSRVLNGHAGRVFAVAWSPDGLTLASASIVTTTHPTVQLWNKNGEITQSLSTSFSGGKFYNLAWSPDGQYLLGGATDYKLWRRDGSLVIWLEGCESCTPAWGMAWSPDSRRWAIGNENGAVMIYTSQGEKVAAVSDQSSVTSLAWSPDSQVLAGAKTLWRADGSVLHTLHGQPPYVNSSAWSPDGRYLATGGSDGLLHMWAADGSSLGVLPGHSAEIRVLSWSPTGSLLASGSTDGTIRLWTP